jgi:hypothetical protein
LKLVVLTQLQPWRWLWLATLAAALLLPVIVAAAWRTGPAGRTTALLLISSWVFNPDVLSLDIALGVLASLAVSRYLRQSHARLVFFGACGLLGLALVWRIASNLSFTDAYYFDPHLPLWMRRSMSFTRDGVVPVAAAVLAWWLPQSPRRRLAAPVLLVLGIALCACVAPQTWARWTPRDFPVALTTRFKAWRALIPPDAEVFWPGAPVPTWLLLERPSYLSVAQTSGFVFSRPAALEMARRAAALAGSTMPPSSTLGWDEDGTGVGLGRKQLELACATAEFKYLVTAAQLDLTPLAALSKEVWPISHGLRLYSCAKRTDT